MDVKMNLRVITKKYAANLKNGLQKIDFGAVCESLRVHFDSEGVTMLNSKNNSVSNFLKN